MSYMSRGSLDSALGAVRRLRHRAGEWRAPRPVPPEIDPEHEAQDYLYGHKSSGVERVARLSAPKARTRKRAPANRARPAARAPQRDETR